MKKLPEFFVFFRKQTFLKLLLAMKMSFLFLCITLAGVQATGLSQTLSLDIEDRSLPVLFSMIEEQSQYKFLFEDDLVGSSSSVSVQAENQTVTQILDRVLPGKGLNYTVFEDNLIVITRSGVSAPQGIEVTGNVTDAETGEPLVGVNIVVKGTTVGTITDSQGDYQLEVPDREAVLLFSYVGYQTAEITVGNQNMVDVQLSPDVRGLDEIIVIGYGTQTSRLISGAVQQLNTDQIQDQPVAQLSQSLQGKFSGVQINQASGKPGGGMTVRVRGQASITADNQPLYVVDGMPIVGDINNLNPNEIESISILKDAAATSLYGSRAANGVVLIETIKGKAGQKQINFNAYVGLQQVPQRGRIDMMNAREFAQFKKEIAEFNGQPVNPAFENPEQYGEGTDWFDVLLEPAPIQNYSLSLRTGTENYNTSAVLGYFSQEGVVVNSGYERYSIRINSNFKPNDKLSFGFNIAPNHTITNNPNTDGTFLFGAIINSAILTSPMADAVNEDGTLPLGALAPGMWPNPNWLRTAKDRINETKNTRLLSNAYIEIEPVSDLKLRSTINVDLAHADRFIFYPSTTGGIFRVPPTIPSGSQYYSNYLSWVNENTLTYEKDFNDHHFGFLAGFTAQRFRNSYSQISGNQFADDKIQLISAAGQITNVSSDIQEWSLLSYLARLDYNYRSKYILSAAIRRDGSSRFGANSKWGNFPSVSVGWVLSDEAFFPQMDEVSLIKLRASYGLVGNFDIGNYTHYSYVTSTYYPFAGTATIGRSVTNLGDSELHWETSGQVNVGLDLYLFSNRLQFKYDYYNKTTDELLYDVDIPRATGFNSIQTNIGEINFWGHEFYVTTRNLVGAFKWSTDFNISFNRNEVVALGNNNAPLHSGQEITNPYITMVAHPVGIFYGMVHQGVYVDQEDFENCPKHTTSQVGTVKFKDVNEDGVITQDDREIIGSPHPDFIFGMTNNFRFRNFDLSVAIAGSYGNDIAARTEQFTTNLDGVFNVLSEVQEHWRSPEDPGSGKYGSLASGTTYLERDWFSSRFLYDGSYLAIKNITLGYTAGLVNSDVFKSIRVYASVQQALTLTNYKGNPEVNITRTGEATSSSLTLGSDFSGYPVPRTISLGINFGF